MGYGRAHVLGLPVRSPYHSNGSYKRRERMTRSIVRTKEGTLVINSQIDDKYTEVPYGIETPVWRAQLMLHVSNAPEMATS